MPEIRIRQSLPERIAERDELTEESDHHREMQEVLAALRLAGVGLGRIDNQFGGE